MRILAAVFLVITAALAGFSLYMTPDATLPVLGRLLIWMGCPFAGGYFLARSNRKIQ